MLLPVSSMLILGTTGGFMDRGNLTSAAGLKSAKGGLRNEGDAASHYSHDVDNMTA